MNVAAICKRLLLYADKRSFSDASSNLEYIADVLVALNGGAQELYANAPDYVCKRFDVGLPLRSPVSITIAGCSQYSQSVGAITTFASWMVGCTVRISGEPENRILSHDGTSGKLAMPLTQSPSTVSAVVFCDSVALDSDVVTVLSKPRIAGSHILEPARDPFDFRRGCPEYPADIPRAYRVDSVSDGTAAPKKYFRVFPLPDRPLVVQCDVRISPPSIVTADLDVGGEGAAATKVIPLPNQWDELYLIPIATQRFTASPFFANDSVRREIARQYDEAIKSLRDMRAQAQQSLQIRPGV